MVKTWYCAIISQKVLFNFFILFWILKKYFSQKVGSAISCGSFGFNVIWHWLIYLMQVGKNPNRNVDKSRKLVSRNVRGTHFVYLIFFWCFSSQLLHVDELQFNGNDLNTCFSQEQQVVERCCCNRIEKQHSNR